LAVMLHVLAIRSITSHPRTALDTVNAGSLLFQSKVQNGMRVPQMFSTASEAGIVPYQKSNRSHNISQRVLI